MVVVIVGGLAGVMFYEVAGMETGMQVTMITGVWVIDRW